MQNFTLRNDMTKLTRVVYDVSLIQRMFRKEKFKNDYVVKISFR